MFYIGILATDFGIRRIRFSLESLDLRNHILSDEENKTKESCDIIKGMVPDFLLKAIRQISEYCTKTGRSFRVPLDIRDYTSFYQQIWEETMGIPYGKVHSYGWLAGQAGKPKAVRAVGQAMAANPIPLIIPCHRIIRQDGRIGGYTGGLEVKRKLLELEGIRVENSTVVPSKTISNP